MELRPLKPKQQEALKAFFKGKDTFVALPTGYGKSISFAVLPLLFDLFFGKVKYLGHYKMSKKYIVYV